MRLSASGTLRQPGEAVAPVWSDTFANLPDATVGSPYSVNLKDYGIDIDEVHAISTSRDVTESIWPTGLSLNTTTGILSGTPAVEDEVAVVTVVGVNGTFDAAADWAFRSTLPNVQVTEDFPDSPSVRDVSDQLSGRTDLSIWDSAIKLYGAGSLRQDLPGNGEYFGSGAETPGAEGAAANWRAPILGGTWDAPVMMQDPGEEIWIAYSMRFNRTECQWPYARRIDAGGGVIHQIKLGIVDEISTASSWEIVLQSNFGAFNGYIGLGTGFGWEEGASTPCSGSDFKRNPSVDNGADFLAGADPGLPSGSGPGSTWTACQQARARFGSLFSYNQAGRPDGFPDPLGYLAMPFDWWVSVMVHVVIIDATTSLIEWYVAPLGQDWTLLFSGVKGHAEDPISGPWGVVNFTNSHTDMKSEDGVRPLGQRWHDGLITRSGNQRIPAPGFSS